MKITDIHIRDPFVLTENGKYYLYGTRGANFGQLTGGFDVYVSSDLEEWSEPVACFESDKYGMNRYVNWAPEVHKYQGKYYLFATFTKENGLRGTFALIADSPEGPFCPHSDGALTPVEWECLDGTLYVDRQGKPYLVFCHEHTQIINGTICYVPLSDDLKHAIDEPKLIFAATDPYYVQKDSDPERHYVTDGPFMFRTKNGALLMLWSTFPNGQYAECVARSDNGEIDGHFEHLEPIITDDGGHGMIFSAGGSLMLTFHSPNECSKERPVFRRLTDEGDHLAVSE
ncbi:MAG: glycoside hydrolase family 43 protein [Clostridiales bacterium]|nr:glycoside hydrolase family 43 protein [Clostridiales bacterium]